MSDCIRPFSSKTERPRGWYRVTSHHKQVLVNTSISQLFTSLLILYDEFCYFKRFLPSFPSLRIVTQFCGYQIYSSSPTQKARPKPPTTLYIEPAKVNIFVELMQLFAHTLSPSRYVPRQPEIRNTKCVQLS